jgi:hypothetical protein
VLDGSGGGELLPLYVRFSSREVSLGEDGVVAPRTPIEVSDLYRGRRGGSGSVAVCLTPVNMERNRGRSSVDAAGGEGVVDEREVVGIIVSKPGGAVESGDVVARHRREGSARGLAGGALDRESRGSESSTTGAISLCSFAGTREGVAEMRPVVEGNGRATGVACGEWEISMTASREEASTSSIFDDGKHSPLVGTERRSMTMLEA